MQQVLSRFIRALRTSGVPVSSTEAIDAAGLLDLFGYQNRQLLKDGFALTLAKSQAEKAILAQVFDLYFSRSPSAVPELADGAQQSAAIDTPPSPASDEPNGSADTDDSQNQSSQSITDLIASADPTRMALAIEQAAMAAGADAIQFASQVPYYSQKMMQALNVDALNQQIRERLETDSDQTQNEAEVLIQARAQVQRLVRRHVEHQYEIYGRPATQTYLNESVAQRNLSQLDQRDLNRMKALIAKMAKRLAIKYGVRQRQKQRGQINIRRTLRQNSGHDGVPFHLSFKAKPRDRAKIVAICDVSGSVARTVRFLLLFLYGLSETVDDLRPFAFSESLHDVTQHFERADFDTAMNTIIRDIGSGSTDYGRTFSELRHRYSDVIDRQTTVIILGDARSNYGQAGMQALREIGQQAKRLVWLNPEAPVQWGTGDSNALRYQSCCHQFVHCANAIDLERAMDRILGAYD